MRALRVVTLALAVSSPLASAQSWNSSAGAYNTGYGRVYGSFGVAMATQNMYNTMQLNMQRSMARAAMIKRFGLAAVEKAEREAKGGQAPKNPELASVTPPPVARGYGKFKREKGSTVAHKLGDGLGSTPEEKKLLATIATGTLQAFEAQPETKPWRNNVAGALAFFIISNVTIATGAAEPSDEVSQALFEGLNQALDQSPDFARASNKDKQELYELLIGFTGIPLAIFSEAEETKDAAELAKARELAGQLLQLVLKTDAAKIKLTN